MRIILILLVLIVFSGMSCLKNVEAPSCIEKKILKIKLQAKWNPPASVTEYEYKGKKVYLFTSDCCDRYLELYDEDCNFICAPSGGFTGQGDGRCTDFYTSATLIRVVWKDER